MQKCLPTLKSQLFKATSRMAHMIQRGTKKEQNTEKPNKKQNDKAKNQTPKTVPDKTLKKDQCRYCNDASHMMTDCPKLAKRRKLEEDPDHPNAPTAKIQVKTKKIAILVPIWITDHQHGT